MTRCSELTEVWKNQFYINYKLLYLPFGAMYDSYVNNHHLNLII